MTTAFVSINLDKAIPFEISFYDFSFEDIGVYGIYRDKTQKGQTEFSVDGERCYFTSDGIGWTG